MSTAIIGIGSNIDPEENIARAKKILAEKHTVLSESEFVRTKPIGTPGQSDFLNGAVMIETPLDCQTLKASLREIEHALGRAKTLKDFGPRTIDLDILVWDGKIVDDDFYTRDFVKKAVLDLMPAMEK